MGVINQYGTLTSGIKNVSGTNLPDVKGSANGTLAGVTTGNYYLPVANTNGYIRFVGGNTTLYSNNMGRIDYTRTTFQYAAANAFTFNIIFRSSKSDANTHTLLTIGDVSGGTIGTWIRILADETLDLYLDGTTSGAKTWNSGISVCDGKWHIFTLTYNNNVMVNYLDGKLIANTTNGTIVGNLYPANSKMSIGAIWRQTTANFAYDGTFDLLEFENINTAYSPAQVADINNEFLMLL